MAGRVPAIHAALRETLPMLCFRLNRVDTRDKRGHDGVGNDRASSE